MSAESSDGKPEEAPADGRAHADRSVSSSDRYNRGGGEGVCGGNEGGGGAAARGAARLQASLLTPLALLMREQKRR